MVDQTENYIITSNRESGFGRYDIMLETSEKLPGIVIEFKVINQRKENSLEETVEAALKQIEEKKYDAELIKRVVREENIHHYGFAFKGKGTFDRWQVDIFGTENIVRKKYRMKILAI